MTSVQSVKANIPGGARPTGTITFLFTDVQGSTQLWERDPTWMEQAHRRHEAILRGAIATHGGWAYKQIGDSFQAAFQTAPAALAAAIAAQQALAAEPWGPPGPIPVRMSLHTGMVEERPDDYFGPLLNRVHRLMSAGHGGQILLSATTYELVRDYLPRGVALLDLGEQRLKDLIRPERVWQVRVDGLPADFPPLRTLDAQPNNLPAQPNAFIGREAQIAAVGGLLRRPDVRLLTLTGPGGTGKTRLALQVAAELLDEFADGAWFVDLAPLTDPALVAGSIVGVLSLQESAARSAQEVLHDYLSAKNLLLVLDNFEQVRPAASLVDTLLRRAPHLKVLITSRVPLHLYGEQEYTVPPLAVPTTLPLPPLERLTQYEAVRLFVERARTVREDFQVTNETAPAVAEICARLDGLPLAIELAAARVRLFAPEALLARLDARLAMLTGGPRNLPARQQTLRATIEWSYNLLSPGEQQLFRRLAVFQGGRTLEAIDTICIGDSALTVDVLDGVEALVGQSLLGTRSGQDGEPRFVMLETIHEYAREILQQGGEAPALCQAHAQYFLRLVEQAERELLGPRHLAWMNRLEDEHDNIRAALHWALDTGAVEVALRLAGALWLFWWTHVHYREGRQWVEAALAQAKGSKEWSGAVRPTVYAKALNTLGLMVQPLGEFALAEKLFTESLAVFEQVGDRWWTAEVLQNLGVIAVEHRNFASGTLLLERSLAIWREVGEPLWGQGRALHNLADAAMEQGEYERATRLFEESLALGAGSGNHIMNVRNLLYLARLRRRQGDSARCADLLRDALVQAQELGHKESVAECLRDWAGLAAASGQGERAALLFGAVDAIYAAGGQIEAPLDHAASDEVRAALRAQIGEAAWQQAWQEGRAMTLDAAITYALNKDPTLDGAASPAQRRTRKQLE